MGKGKTTTDDSINIIEIHKEDFTVHLLGTSPLIYNAMSEKAWHELLMPAPKKNAAEKAANLKHDPFLEYRNSVYRSLVDGPTRLNFPASAFKKALASAALDIPGAAKAQIGRLVWVNGVRVEMFGVPKMLCAITRSADMNRTPDVRTRAILPEWACTLSIQFMRPILKAQTVANLLGAAGFTQGIGDWRQQKGSGSHGQFTIVAPDHPDFVRICKEQGRTAQDAALKDPEFYDDETEKLMTWFTEERGRREGKRSNGKAAHVETVEA